MTLGEEYEFNHILSLQNKNLTQDSYPFFESAYKPVDLESAPLA